MRCAPSFVQVLAASAFAAAALAAQAAPSRPLGIRRAAGSRRTSVSRQLLGVSEPIRDVALGFFHTCATARTGNLYCWGENGKSQVGDGASRVLWPTLTGVPNIVSVAAGDDHTCAVNDLGEVYCWGSNEHGQLAGANATMSAVPIRVMLPGPARAVFSSRNSICALTLGKTLFCWGDGSRGQTGQGALAGCPNGFAAGQPACRVTQPFLVLSEIAKVSPLLWGFCATNTTGGQFCWGDSIGLSPVPMEPADQYLDSCRIVGGANAFQCKGTNWGGMLGLPVVDQVYTDYTTVLDGIQEFMASWGPSFCVRNVNHEIVCWGDNEAGKIAGVMAGAILQTPVLYPTDPSENPSPVVKIAIAREHSCAVTEAGGLFCFGSNNHRQLAIVSDADAVYGPSVVVASLPPPPADDDVTDDDATVDDDDSTGGGAPECGLQVPNAAITLLQSGRRAIVATNCDHDVEVGPGEFVYCMSLPSVEFNGATHYVVRFLGGGPNEPIPASACSPGPAPMP